MSSTSIIAKITEIYDRNIEFDQDFFKNETIRGIEHTVIKGKLTYIPDSCEHCNGENKIPPSRNIPSRGDLFCPTEKKCGKPQKFSVHGLFKL